MQPIFGVGFEALILSMKTIPGSPFFQAWLTIRSKTSRALSDFTTFFVRGLIREYSESSLTACMKLSVSATEILKLLKRALLSFAVMKFRMSGWSTRRIPIFAPRRVPPCFTASVAVSKTVMNDTGPEEIPLVEPTISPPGLRLEKLKPVPPPDLCMIAVCLTASKIDSMESSTGSTKQALSCPSLLPAFMMVGLFGRKSSDTIIE